MKTLACASVVIAMTLLVWNVPAAQAVRTVAASDASGRCAKSAKAEGGCCSKSAKPVPVLEPTGGLW